MKRVLIANRGEIAVRIARACFDEGLECVLAASSVDRESLAAKLADAVVVIGPATASESYLSPERIVQAALASGCDAVHPGYGFLSEQPSLARACAENGLTFVGPPAEIMERSGDKLRAREMAKILGIPIGVGTGELTDVDEAVRVAAELDDFPFILKASAGGGGRGMTIVHTLADLEGGFAAAQEEARRAFNDGRLYLERYVERARHVEVQILADSFGAVRHLGERDCSVQRRHQKLVEESPAVDLPAALVDKIRATAVELARHLGYVGAGTVEFLVDLDRGDFLFLEINARVQVEHPVSEMVTGIDIVREQLRVAAGQPIGFSQHDVQLRGHSIEVRVNSEDAENGFRPTPGTITEWVVPSGMGIRVDTHIRPGATIPPFYDSMIGKIIVHAEDRTAAITLLDRVLSKTRIDGVPTTVPALLAIIRSADFASTPVHTRWLDETFLPGWMPKAGGGK